MTIRGRVLAIAMAITTAIAAMATPATAERGGAGWELLGEARVAFRGDHDSIVLGHNEDYYRARAYRRLRFVTEGGEVRMRAVRLVFLNGYAETYDVARTLSPGEGFEIDLRGERSFIREVHMVHKGKFGIDIGGGGIRLAKPKVKVFGQNVRFERAPPPVAFESRRGPSSDWEVLGSDRFDRRDQRSVIPVGRREGRIGQIALTLEGEPVVIRGLRVRFGNGEVQTIDIERRMREGERTPPIDLEGDRRFIEEVTVLLDPRERGGSVKLVLFGLDGPGRERDERVSRDDRFEGRRDGRDDRFDDRRGDRDTPPPRGVTRPAGNWIPLGRQAVAPGVDRDAVDISRGTQGFDRLHFIAETNEVLIRSIRITYANGYAESLDVNRPIRAGGDLTIDLPGRRSFITRIESVYSPRPGAAGKTVVSIFGEAVDGRR